MKGAMNGLASGEIVGRDEAQELQCGAGLGGN